MPEIGVGLIGCGTIAYWQHLRNLGKIPGARITALADPDPEALARAVKKVDAPSFKHPDELLRRDDVDAVIIASPAALHAGHLLAALHAGKHSYVEKPLAHDAASLAEVMSHATGTELVFAVGYNFRFHPGVLQLQKAITSDLIGRVHALVSHFTETFDTEEMPAWRRARAQGGGVMLDLATHHIDLYGWLLGQEVTDCQARLDSYQTEQDSAMLTAETSGGVALGGYFAHGPNRSHAVTAHGAAGVLRLDLHRGCMTLQRNRKHGYGVRSRKVWPETLDLSWRLRKRLQPSYDPSHALCLRAFVQAVQNPAERNPDLASIQDGATALRVVLEAE